MKEKEIVKGMKTPKPKAYEKVSYKGVRPKASSAVKKAPKSKAKGNKILPKAGTNEKIEKVKGGDVSPAKILKAKRYSELKARIAEHEKARAPRKARRMKDAEKSMKRKTGGRR